MINEWLSLLEGVSVMRAGDVRERGGADSLQEIHLKRDLFQEIFFLLNSL